MPHLEDRTPQHLRRIAPHKPEVTKHLTQPPTESPLPCCTLHPLVVLSEVTRQHDLIQQEAPLLRIRRSKQVTIRHAKHLLQHPHHRARESHHTQRAQRTQRLLTLKLRETLLQHEVVVQQLPQPDTLRKQMTVDMHQYIHPVESSIRYGERCLFRI